MTGPVLDGLCQGERVEAVVRVETGQRGYDCQPVRAVALRLGQALALQESEQAGIGLVAHAADLQVAAGGDVEMAVAAFPRSLGDRTRLVGREPAGRRMQAHEQAVAGLHRPADARAPAAAPFADRMRAHSAASFRPSSKKAATELRRLSQRPRARASAKRSRMAWAAAGLAVPIRCQTGSSAIRAVKTRSKPADETASVVAAKAKSASTPCAISAAPRQPCRSWPSIQRGIGQASAHEAVDILSAACGLSAPADGWCRGCRGQGIDAERLRRGREAADGVGGGIAVEDVALGDVAHMHEGVGLLDPVRKARIGMRPRRRRRRHGRCLRDRCGRDRLASSIRRRAPAPATPAP